MRLSKEEKKFWQRNYRIEKVNEIPLHWGILKSADSDYDDDFFYYLSLRVESINEIYLKDSLITDKAVQYMAGFKELKNLLLRKNRYLTKSCILYFNQMQDLEKLNLTNTAITLTDLYESLNNKNLKEVFVSSEETEDNLEEKAFILKEKMPNCNIYLDCSHSTDVFGNLEKPIF
ncbi:hypothetical protein [Chryseobacterium sp. JAH]|uniref:hypothetical protein n=1 Tax=Chryseobacterium sp. JAH TaxID=1742858 RepID=UPI00068D1126|nr:hypothetical protein [Chryseobacterium sp. JAH]KUJ50497.1 hypothetical protein AR685_14470 [Chryseobacterium sp. JAH]